MAEYQYVIYETDGNIARITLNRPEKLNAFPFYGGITADFHAALTEAEEDDDIKVVIIKANGRAFSAGHDLEEVGFVYGYGTGEAGERRPSQRIRLKIDRMGFGENHRRLFYFPKITIAQVHGYCIGEGMIIATLCDITIAAEDAQLGHSEQRLGFAGSGIGSIPHLMLAVGWKRGRELLLTGRHISGREAAEIGLVNRAVPSDKIEDEVNKMAEAMCLLPRDGIAIGKAMTEAVYDRFGLGSGFVYGYIGHTLFTNLRWESDEYNFFRERRDKSAKAGFHGRDDRFAGKV